MKSVKASSLSGAVSEVKEIDEKEDVCLYSQVSFYRTSH